MGAWGTGLYSDDTACDVRDDYKDILGDGIVEPEATRRLLTKWSSELADPDTAPVFWLALADVQWNLGRLQEQVKKSALMIIENDSDLRRWLTNRNHTMKRKAVLERLQQKLRAAPPAEKKVKKRYVDSTDWNLGDVYSFQMLSGKLALFHVIGFHNDKGGRGPVCEIFDWTGDNAPDQRAMEKLGYKFAKKPHQHLSQFLLASLSTKDFQRQRVSLVAQGVVSKQKLGGYSVLFWRYIDKEFEQLFDLH
jgi:hypothetical protein